MVTIYFGDCLDIMKMLPNNVAHMSFNDVPYGKTACKWDTVIPFGPMWLGVERIVKDNGANIFTGTEPFSSALRMSNIKNYKYDWIWQKAQGTMPMQAPFKPITIHESISIFSLKASTYSKKGCMVYNPQKTKGIPYKANQIKRGNIPFHSDPSGDHFSDNQGDRYPTTIKSFKKDDLKIHATQKPVELVEYMIKTYSNEGDTILDITAGSGTTGVASINLKRDCILIEKLPLWFNVSCMRLKGINNKTIKMYIASMKEEYGKEADFLAPRLFDKVVVINA